ncbi:SacI homology domain-containing protein [Dipodascopsis uninucleata]
MDLPEAVNFQEIPPNFAEAVQELSPSDELNDTRFQKSLATLGGPIRSRDDAKRKSSGTRSHNLFFEQENEEIDEGSETSSSSIRDATLNRMCKYTLYETKTRFYLIGSNINDTRFRVLKIDLAVEQDDLSLTQDDTIYTYTQIIELLEAIQDGNPVGGLIKRLTLWGVIGFIRFTQCYYMAVITKRSAVALLGGHYIYHIDATELIPLASSASYRKPHRNSREARFLSTFQNLDLSKTFYFSYSYDITHTLQHNLNRERQRVKNNVSPDDWKVYLDYNEMFVWNHYLLKPVYESKVDAMAWCLPIIHGFIDQANISVFGKNVSIAILARRSHYFAGARFLKRGANDEGYVANDVETEQIVSDMLSTSFHSVDGKAFANTRYTSFVQHRGSIPLFWTQDVSGMSPKPPIELNVVDPFFSAAALHFDDMFKRYGTPVVVFNLIKTRERNPRETILLHEFEQCLQYLNQFLPEKAKILYTSWDMSRASKGRDQEVIEFLEEYADKVLTTIKIFHNGSDPISLQSGICRTNCIDCLDRTNAAQFVIGKRALGYQLHALGIIDGTTVDYDTDAVNLLTEMYHDHGDTIALQYGGSHLVNTMETYRRINQWTSHSRDVIESIRRYYSNSFIDNQRQEAINLFLGNYVFEKDQPMLWDLSTDYYLHHAVISGRKRRSYTRWWTPINIMKSLSEREIQKIPNHSTADLKFPLYKLKSGYFDNYWMEYYKPKMLSSFSKIFHFNMNSTLRYLPSVAVGNGKYNLSPFECRQLHIDHQPRELIDKDRIADDRSSIISVISNRRATRRFLDIGFIDFSSKLPERSAPPSPREEPDLTLPANESSSYQIPICSDDEFDSSLWYYGKVYEKSDIFTDVPDISEIVNHSMKPSVSPSATQDYKKYLTNLEIAPLSRNERKNGQNSLQHMEFESYVKYSSSPDSIQLLLTSEDMGLYENTVLMNITDDELTKRTKLYQIWSKGKYGTKVTDIKA